MSRKKIWFSMLLSGFIFISGCSQQPTIESSAQTPVFEDELNAKLSDTRLLNRLGVEQIIVLEFETYRVTIGEPDNREPIGELYYTIQDGWHLRAENEVLEFFPGEGWLIAEQ